MNTWTAPLLQCLQERRRDDPRKKEAEEVQITWECRRPWISLEPTSADWLSPSRWDRRCFKPWDMPGPRAKATGLHGLLRTGGVWAGWIHQHQYSTLRFQDVFFKSRHHLFHLKNTIPWQCVMWSSYFQFPLKLEFDWHWWWYFLSKEHNFHGNLIILCFTKKHIFPWWMMIEEQSCTWHILHWAWV